jgi:hypothetical protein
MAEILVEPAGACSIAYDHIGISYWCLLADSACDACCGLGSVVA